MLKKDGMAVNSYEQVVDLLFLSESCVVSKAVTQLMELVHQTLKVYELKNKIIWFSFCCLWNSLNSENVSQHKRKNNGLTSWDAN